MTEPATSAAQRAAPLVVDIVSDVVCPWCFIGKRKLEAALAELRGREPDLDATVRWHPFQLNPDLPAEGVSRAAYLEAKFGGKARTAKIYERVREVGTDVGIAFDFDRIERQPNTLDAHRLIGWAQQRGDANDLVERLFHAYFLNGRYVGDREVLVDIAQAAGHSGEAVRAMLASGEGGEAVRAADREAREAGIGGVPFFIFGGRTALGGAHDPPMLLQAIDEARKSEHR